MAGVGKLVEELRRKLGEWAQAIEEALQGDSPPRELVPVKVPVRDRDGRGQRQR